MIAYMGMVHNKKERKKKNNNIMRKQNSAKWMYAQHGVIGGESRIGVCFVRIAFEFIALSFAQIVLENGV